MSPKTYVYWHTKRRPDAIFARRLDRDIEADIVVIGGGITGLMCAQRLREDNRKVVILEQDVCGAGASGASAGCVVPEWEIDARTFAEHSDPHDASRLLAYARGGAEALLETIHKYELSCDLLTQDFLFVAPPSHELIEKSRVFAKSFGQECADHSRDALSLITGDVKSLGGISCVGSFGISPYLYCQELKEILVRQGVDIYEKTPASHVEEGKVRALGYTVRAKSIAVCAGRFLNSHPVDMCVESYAMSSPLSKKARRKIFPNVPYIVTARDGSNRVIGYRLTSEGRLVASIRYPNRFFSRFFWAGRAGARPAIISYFREHFPHTPMYFEYSWRETSVAQKSRFPIVMEDENRAGVYYVGGAPGLSWAAAAGRYAAEKIIGGRSDFDRYFTPARARAFGSFFKNPFRASEFPDVV